MALPLAKILKVFSLALLGLSALGCTRQATQGELRLFTWSEYFTTEELQAFEQKTGLKVKVDYYSSNEEMLTKIQLTADGSGYDLIVPSDYMVRTMTELKLLRKLDHAQLPFLKDFAPADLHPPYDPSLQHSVPLAIGLTGIAWNEKLLPQLPKDFGWKDVFELPAVAGKVTLLDDTKEALQVALLLQGKDLTSANQADMQVAFDYLNAHKPQLKGFTSETRTAIEADECALCMAYSGDVLSVAEHKPEIHFVRPREGLTTWADNFAIPVNAPHPEAAYRFMAEVLSPEGARAFTNRTRYRTLQGKARALELPEIRISETVYPPAEALSKFHYLVERHDLGDFIDRQWALLKSH